MRSSEVIADPDYALLKERIIGHTGFAYYADRDDELAARIARRPGARNVRQCQDYLRILDGPGGEREMAALAADLSIGETHFFRQAEHF